MLSPSCLLHFFSLRKCLFIPAHSNLHAPRKNWSSRHMWNPAYFQDSLIKFSHVINLCWQFSIYLARMTSERGREGGGERGLYRHLDQRIAISHEYSACWMQLGHVWSVKIWIWDMLLCGPLLANSCFPEQISMTFVWINSSFKRDTSVLIFLGKKFALTCLLLTHTLPCSSHSSTNLLLLTFRSMKLV